MRAKLRYVPLVILAACLVLALTTLDRFGVGFIVGVAMTSAVYGIAGWGPR